MKDSRQRPHGLVFATPEDQPIQCLQLDMTLSVSCNSDGTGFPDEEHFRLKVSAKQILKSFIQKTSYIIRAFIIHNPINLLVPLNVLPNYIYRRLIT